MTATSSHPQIDQSFHTIWSADCINTIIAVVGSIIFEPPIFARNSVERGVPHSRKAE